MASFTTITERKRSRRHKNAGRARKAKLAKQSTPSYADLFAGFGEPGQPAPAVAKDAGTTRRAPR